MTPRRTVAMSVYLPNAAIISSSFVLMVSRLALNVREKLGLFLHMQLRKIEYVRLPSASLYILPRSKLTPARAISNVFAAVGSVV